MNNNSKRVNFIEINLLKGQTDNLLQFIER